MHDLPLPNLLDHMGAEDGPSCSEEEKDAKPQRSASTTPRSTMGTHPNDYDRVMGVTSVGSQESVRFGEENDPETEDVVDRAAHSSVDLDDTPDEEERRTTMQILVLLVESSVEVSATHFPSLTDLKKLNRKNCWLKKAQDLAHPIHLFNPQSDSWRQLLFVDHLSFLAGALQ